MAVCFAQIYTSSPLKKPVDCLFMAYKITFSKGDNNWRVNNYRSPK